MAQFAYQGLKSDGSQVSGRLSASDSADAQRQLEAQEIAAFVLEAVADRERSYARKRARPRDRQRFMRQLSVLLRAGTPLLAAFDNLAAEEPCRDLADIAGAVRRDLRSGARLSATFKTRLTGFPAYVPRLIELGEATGRLPAAFAEIAAQMEQELKSAEEVRNALAYPAFLASAGLVAVLFMFLFVVPRFAALLGEDRSSLPGFSRVVIETGVAMRENLPATLIVLALIVALGVWMARSPAFRTGLQDVLHAAPVVGAFFAAVDTARWARIAGTALQGGAPLLEALSLAESAVWSRRRRQALVEVRRAMRSGEALDEALQAHTDFDAMTINLVRTGRASASLDEMLIFVAEIHEQESRNAAKRLTSLAEPMAILFIASVVGVIVVSLVMAMTSLYDVAL